MNVDAQTLAFYDEFAAKYAGKFNRPKPSPMLQSFLSLLPKGGAVLDLGCGPGQAAAFIKAAGFLELAMDPSQGMLDMAATTGVTTRRGGFADLNDQAAFDGIWCNFALLHAPRDHVPAYLGAMRRALKDRGVLHLAVKSGEGEARDKLGRKYTYFTEDELNTLLHQAGFAVINTQFGKERGMAGTLDDWIAIRARAID